jgi:hypothetical protein
MVNRYLNVNYGETIRYHFNISSIFSVTTGLLLSILIYHFSFMKVTFIFVGIGGIYLIFRLPELGVVLSFSSAIFKEWLTEVVPMFAAFDFTIAIFGLTFISIFFTLIKKGTIFDLEFDKKYVPLFLFTAYLIFSLLYTPAFSYGSFKAFSFLTFNWGLFFAPILIIKDEKSAWKMIHFLIAIGIIISVYMLVNLVHNILTISLIYTFRATFLGVNTIGFANWVGNINIILITLLPVIKNKKLKFAALIAIVIFTLAMVVTNSRGPMFSFLVTVAIIFFINYKKLPVKKVVLIILVSLLFIILVLSILPPQLFERYTGLIDQGQQVSKRVTMYTVGTRLEFWKASLISATDSVCNLFFGIGSGGFPKMFYHLDFLWYPHNIFMEVLCELGLVGVFLICWHIFSVFINSIKTLRYKLATEQKYLLLTFLMAAVFNFIAAQFSSDLNGNRKMWLFLGALTALNSLFLKQQKICRQ